MPLVQSTDKTPTHPAKVIAGTALLLAGYTSKRMARFLNLKKWRSDEIVKIKERAVKELEADGAWTEVVKANLTKGYLLHAGAALVQSAEKLSEASSAQAMVVSGIAVDKALALGQKGPMPPQQHLHLHVSKTLAEIESRMATLAGSGSDET